MSYGERRSTRSAGKRIRMMDESMEDYENEDGSYGQGGQQQPQQQYGSQTPSQYGNTYGSASGSGGGFSGGQDYSSGDGSAEAYDPMALYKQQQQEMLRQATQHVQASKV